MGKKKKAEIEQEQKRQQEQKKEAAQAKKRNKLVKGGKLGRPRKLTPEELRRGVEAYFASITYQEPVMREEFVVLDVDKKTGAVTYQLDAYGHRMVRQVPVLGANGKPLMRTCWIEAPGDFGLCNYLKISRDTWDRYGHMIDRLEQDARDGGTDCHGHAGLAMTGSEGGPSGGRPMTAPTGGSAGGRPMTAPTDGGDGGPGDPAPTGEYGGQGSGRPTGVPTEEEIREARDYAEIYTLARGRVCAYLESAAETRGGKGAQFKLERIYGLTGEQKVTVSAAGSIEEFLDRIGAGVEY